MRNAISCILLGLCVFQLHAEIVNVKLSTTMGDIHLELYETKAPITVNNFLKYIDNGIMDNGVFYRTVRMDNQIQNDIKIEVIQGGIFTAESNLKLQEIPLERTKDTGIKHLDGTISMARGEPDSATTEFFICINDQPALDYGGKRNPDGQGFAAFGNVVSGMDVIRAIHNVETIKPDKELNYTSGQMIKEPIKFLEVKRL